MVTKLNKSRMAGQKNLNLLQGSVCLCAQYVAGIFRTANVGLCFLIYSPSLTRILFSETQSYIPANSGKARLKELQKGQLGPFSPCPGQGPAFPVPTALL